MRPREMLATPRAATSQRRTPDGQQRKHSSHLFIGASARSLVALGPPAIIFRR